MSVEGDNHRVVGIGDLEVSKSDTAAAMEDAMLEPRLVTGAEDRVEDRQTFIGKRPQGHFTNPHRQPGTDDEVEAPVALGNPW
ncbi:hypothetical protein PG996_013159 [Apiospora saccharicola]|uniref:Uncharacterized protein n=1 Tax=Apiospora saccharicola TaxID=335842 RepID=A0ABR1U4U1_9PEZI